MWPKRIFPVITVREIFFFFKLFFCNTVFLPSRVELCHYFRMCCFRVMPLLLNRNGNPLVDPVGNRIGLTKVLSAIIPYMESIDSNLATDIIILVISRNLHIKKSVKQSILRNNSTRFRNNLDCCDIFVVAWSLCPIWTIHLRSCIHSRIFIRPVINIKPTCYVVPCHFHLDRTSQSIGESRTFGSFCSTVTDMRKNIIELNFIQRLIDIILNLQVILEVTRIISYTTVICFNLTLGERPAIVRSSTFNQRFCATDIFETFTT